MKEKTGYIPQNERKKILLICDDIRVHSGVATIARELVIHTAHHFNWVNIAGALNHPDKGKRFDISQDTNTNAGIEDSSVFLYPVNGYGDANFVRHIMGVEKPDAIMLITDPRYFEWLFQIENEIRKNIPIVYLNIWDDYPAPLYNKSFYESCDALLAISKQTKLINELVLGDKAEYKITEYVPHGLNEKVYRPIEDENEKKELENFKNNFFQNQEKDFVVFFNSRNIRRKQIPDTMLSFRYFLDTLPKEKAEKCAMILHTEIVSDHGTDLDAVRNILFQDYPNAIWFSTQKLSPQQLNQFYNIADAQILLTSNEGWGLSLTEAILAGTPIIANVTGGMQDQMRFESENGEWYTPTSKLPSNHNGTLKKHGSWAFPVYPTNRSLQGSPKTPYIWDDRCRPEDAAARISEVYSLGREKRKELGREGRNWAVNEAGFTSQAMGDRAINAIDKLFNTWTPREKYELINCNEVEEDTIKHELLY